MEFEKGSPSSYCKPISSTPVKHSIAQKGNNEDTTDEDSMPYDSPEVSVDTFSEFEFVPVEVEMNEYDVTLEVNQNIELSARQRRRLKMTEEQLAAVRAKDATRQRMRRMMMSEAEKAFRREMDTCRQRERRKKLLEEMEESVLIERRAKDAARARQRRLLMSEEKKAELKSWNTFRTRLKREAQRQDKSVLAAAGIHARSNETHILSQLAKHFPGYES